ncbi:hypothetical protein, partial [Klebsiella pneumoniae]|uniref:hypothetical protein n=1 Tax=Klebsiella pneumoniae TaxID=573 RepID=UPI001C6F7F43
GEGELMAHDVPLGCAPDEYDDLISGTCSHLPKVFGLLLWNHYVVMGIGAMRLSILLFLDASGISLYSGRPPNEVAIYFPKPIQV